MRRLVATALALTIICSGMSGCSQPIDTGSSIPAQSQPIVALLALIGLGIGITAWHHHNEHRGGGGSGPSVFPAQFTVPPLVAGYKAVDLAPDPVNATIGALEVPIAGAGTGKFDEIESSGGIPQSFGGYSLPSGYSPEAVSLDPNGVAWFVDASGRVQGCDVLTSAMTCSSKGTFSDGLGGGARSIAADINIIVVVVDAGGGKVKWWATQGGTATGTGTYTPASSTSPIFAADAVSLTTTGPSGFTVYHQDGRSDFLTFGVSGSTLTISAQPNFSFNPLPLAALSQPESETSVSKIAFFSFTGAPTTAYSLTKYETTTAAGITAPTATSELIAFNGHVGTPSGGGTPFVPPLSSPRFDNAELTIWAIDAAGNIVAFAPF